MKLFFVVNPISGGIDKEPFLHQAKALCNKFNIDFHIFYTTGKNDEENLRTVLNKQQPTKVVSVGGDGTTLFTAMALMETNFPMGIIPLGSANGMAKELFVNQDPDEALKEIIMSNRVAGLDVLKINDNYFTMHLGDVGLNAQIVDAYDKDPNRGMATYAKYFFEVLHQLKPFPVQVKANNTTVTDHVFMIGICNARKYGTGVPLNVNGNPMDGKFELVLVNRVDSTSLIKSALSSLDEKYLDTSTANVVVTDYAEINFNEPRLLQLDGEVIGKFDHIKIEIIKGAVPFITHNDNIYLS